MKTLLLLLTGALCAAWPVLPAAAQDSQIKTFPRKSTEELAKDADIVRLRDNIVATVMEREGRNYNEKMVADILSSLREDGTWPGIDYNLKATGTWPCSDHMANLLRLAYAYNRPGGKFHHDPAVRKAYHTALSGFDAKAIRNERGERDTRGGNWWFWNFAVPIQLGKSLLLMQNEVEPARMTAILDSIEWCMQNPFDWYMSPELAGGGQNPVSGITGNLYFAILTGNAENIQRLSQYFSDNIRISHAPEEGFTEDGGFRAHYMLDVGAYCAQFLTDLQMFHGFFLGTRFQIGRDKLDLIARNLYTGMLWLDDCGYLDMGVWGRHGHCAPYDRKRTGFLADTVTFFAGTPNSYQLQFQKLAELQKTNAPFFSGVHNFYECDMVVSRTPKSYLSLRMNSDRNIGSESFHGAGMKTLFLGDGCTWIFNNPDEFYTNNVWAALNWDRLPGTTVIENDPTVSYRCYVYGSERFVGAAADAENAVAAMRLGKVSVPLVGHKSWFFFDGTMVALGSNIHSSSEKGDVLTVIDQRPALASSRLLVDGKEAGPGVRKAGYAHLNGVGYAFLGDEEIVFGKFTGSGSWYDISLANSDRTLYSMPFYSLAVNHGRKPRDGAYAYAVMPSASPEEAETLGKRFEVIERSKLVHAVRDRRSGMTGIVFWPDDEQFLSIDLGGPMRKSEGILHRSEGNHVNKTALVGVAGEAGRGAAVSRRNQHFAVNGERLAGVRDVEMTIRWFDDVKQPKGACFRVGRVSGGKITYGGYCVYRGTGKWREDKVLLEDVTFDQDVVDPGADFVIRHSDSRVDMADSRFQLLSSQFPLPDNAVYGPLIQRIELKPAGGSAPKKYAARCGIIAVDTPCIVLYGEKDGVFELTLTDPTHESRRVRLTVDKPLTALSLPEGAVCEPAGANATRLSIPVSGGRSVPVRLAVRN